MQWQRPWEKRMFVVTRLVEGCQRRDPGQTTSLLKSTAGLILHPL